MTTFGTAWRSKASSCIMHTASLQHSLQKLLHTWRETINSSFLFLGEPERRVGGAGVAVHLC